MNYLVLNVVSLFENNMISGSKQLTDLPPKSFHLRRYCRQDAVDFVLIVELFQPEYVLHRLMANVVKRFPVHILCAMELDVGPSNANQMNSW